MIERAYLHNKLTSIGARYRGALSGRQKTHGPDYHHGHAVMFVNEGARIEQRDILDVCAIIMHRKRFRRHTSHKQVDYECHE